MTLGAPDLTSNTGYTRIFGPDQIAGRGIFFDAPTQRVESSSSTVRRLKTRQRQVWAERTGEPPNEDMLRFCSGRDVRALPMADLALVPYDLWTNAAHVLMLERQGIVSTAAAAAILGALHKIEEDYVRRQFHLDAALEDVHINVEARVAEHAGARDAGLMHTGRSRNDQSATDMRLWLRDALLDFESDLLVLIDTLARKADEWKSLVMPGYTHGQPAMVSTLGYWAAGHVEALLRDAGRLRRCYRAHDQNPLGAGAGFGTSWEIDRRLTTTLLGFAEMQVIGIDCVTNRWEAEADALQALCFTYNHLSILAQDLIHFSSAANQFLRLPPAFTTGSSIMPQKQNPDFAEVTRAKAAFMHGNLTALMSLAKGMGSGYNRDSQWSKYLVMDAFGEAALGAVVFAGALRDMKPNRRLMYLACRQGFMNAVEIADYVAREFGIEFRRSHQIIARAVRASGPDRQLTRESVHRELEAEEIDADIPEDKWLELCEPAGLVNLRVSEGSPSVERMDAALASIHERLAQTRRGHAERTNRLVRAINTLRRLVDEVMARGRSSAPAP